jgi:hypothetical protein
MGRDERRAFCPPTLNAGLCPLPANDTNSLFLGTIEISPWLATWNVLPDGSAPQHLGVAVFLIIRLLTPQPAPR